MKIRFLEYAESQVPGFPFCPGQVIEIAQPSAELLALLDGVRAVALRAESDEDAAVAVGASERAVRPAPKAVGRKR